MMIPIMIKIKLTNDRESHHDVVFSSIDTLINEFKQSFKTSLYQYYTIFLLYRFSLAFCLVVLPDSPSVQLFMIAVFQILTCIDYLVLYIYLFKPFKYKRDSLTVFISELLSLVLILFIGVRLMDGISNKTKYALSSVCVLNVWIIEVVIIIRYALSISTNTQTALESANNETQSPGVITVKDEINDSSFNNNRPLHATEKTVKNLENVSESIDFEEIHDICRPMEPYKYLSKTDEIKSENKSSFEDDNKTSNKIKKNQIGTDVSALNTRDSALAHNSLITDYINTSSRYGFREDRTDLAEDLRIKNIVQKANNAELSFGNRGLGFNK